MIDKDSQIKDILKHNEAVIDTVRGIEYTISVLEKELVKEVAELIAPCMHCPYDGVYRCEACVEEHYAGFNKKDLWRR